MSDVIIKTKTKRREINSLLQQQQRKEGEKDTIISQMKEKFGVETLEAGDNLLKELAQTKENLKNELEEIDTEMGCIIDQANPEKT